MQGRRAGDAAGKTAEGVDAARRTAALWRLRKAAAAGRPWQQRVFCVVLENVKTLLPCAPFEAAGVLSSGLQFSPGRKIHFKSLDKKDKHFYF